MVSPIRNTKTHIFHVSLLVLLHCEIWFTSKSRSSQQAIFHPFITPSRPYKTNPTKTVIIKIIYNSHNSTCPIWKPQQNKLHVRSNVIKKSIIVCPFFSFYDPLVPIICYWIKYYSSIKTAQVFFITSL